MPRDLLRITAFHEAAHSVTQTRLGFTCLQVTIEPRGLAGLACHNDDDMAFATLGADGIYSIPEQASRDMLTNCYAGYCGAIEAGDDEEFARIGAEDDFADANERREKIGVSEEEGIAAAFAFVREPKNWRAIQAVAAELIEHGRLDSDEVEIIIEIADGDAQAADLMTFREMRALALGPWPAGVEREPSQAEFKELQEAVDQVHDELIAVVQSLVDPGGLLAVINWDGETAEARVISRANGIELYRGNPLVAQLLAMPTSPNILPVVAIDDRSRLIATTRIIIGATGGGAA